MTVSREIPLLLSIPINQIGELAPDDYVGLIDETAVEHLTARFAAEGQHMPIWVRQNGNAAKVRYSVICGRHRLRAAKALGWNEITGQVLADMHSTRAELEALQLIENLDRRVLRPIERAKFIMVRWCYVAKSCLPPSTDSQQKQAIRVRWSVLAILANTSTADRDVVDKATAATGVEGVKSARTVRRYRSIYEKLVAPFPDKVQEINAHPLGASREAVEELGRVAHNVPKEHKTDWENPKSSREKAIAMLLSKPDWTNITEVLTAAGVHASNGNRSTKVAADGHKLRKIWSGMTPDAQRAHFVEMANQMPPSVVDQVITALRPRSASFKLEGGSGD